MFDKFLDKLSAIYTKLLIAMGGGWPNGEPVYYLHFNGYFYIPPKEGDTLAMLGTRVPYGFNTIRNQAITPDAHGLCGDPDKCFVFHIISDHAATRQGRRVLRNWCIANGMAREYIDDGIVKFITITDYVTTSAKAKA